MTDVMQGAGESLTRAVLECAGDAVVAVDPSHAVTVWNPAAERLFGWSAEEVLGSIPPIVPEELAAEHTAVLDRVREGGRHSMVCRRRHRAGHLIDVQVDTSALRDEVGALLGWVSVFHHSESDRMGLDRTVDRVGGRDLFLATASHELRTPLTVVQGYASTLVNRWEQLTDTGRRRAVATIADRAHSLGRLVENLLLGSRAGVDKLAVTIECFDLAELLDGVVAGVGSLSERHQVTLAVPPGLPKVSGDAMATDVILCQLLENAVKYSPDGGTVAVTARISGSDIVVTVEDEGIGIPPSDRERIFERFVQGEAGDRRRFGGIGLGLYIARRLALAQHGDLTAHARTCGGTCMRLVLKPAV